MCDLSQYSHLRIFFNFSYIMENRNLLRLFLASLSVGALLIATGCSSTDEEVVETGDDTVMEEVVVEETVEVGDDAAVEAGENPFEEMSDAEVQAAFEADGFVVAE